MEGSVGVEDIILVKIKIKKTKEADDKMRELLPILDSSGAKWRSAQWRWYCLYSFIRTSWVIGSQYIPTN